MAVQILKRHGIGQLCLTMGKKSNVDTTVRTVVRKCFTVTLRKRSVWGYEKNANVLINL
ncbi:UNVERIFIED_CONTAM: hypothetical protein FKN15_003703 [Acipenser sinensis]